MQREERISYIFNELFHSNDTVTSSCPGRVNLIGEHIDYSGYSVFPCAIENDIIVKSMIRNNELNSHFEIIIHNTNSIIYSSNNINVLDRLTELNNVQLRNISIQWTDYILCGLIAILNLIKDVNTNDDIYDIIKNNLQSKQLCILVDGNIIESSGLSSSSALVVASALSFSKCLVPYISKLQSTISSEELAASCVDSERMVGTLGGGMDQTVCVHAIKNSALHIFFIPKTSIINVKLPCNLSLVICHCFVSSEKAKGAKLSFNTKFVECRLAALLLTKMVDDNKCNVNNFPLSLGDAECILLGKNNFPVDHIEYIDEAIIRLDKMIKLTEEFLEDENYGISDIYSFLDLTYNVDSIAHIYFKDKGHNAAIEVLNQEPPIFFKLKKCAIHVYSEAKRVLQFRKLCDLNDETVLNSLGILLNESHASLRDLYNCSCPELDLLVSECQSNSYCLGSRLTGAGWGGCNISLVKTENSNTFLHEIRNGSFYSNFSKEEVNAKTFITIPSNGARII